MGYLLANAVSAPDNYGGTGSYYYLRKRPYTELIIMPYCTAQNGNVKIDACFDNSSWNVSLLAETVMVAAATPISYRLTEKYSYIRIAIKNAAAGQVAVTTIGWDMKKE